MAFIIRQLQYFCSAFFLGLCCIFFYDFIRALRRKVLHGMVAKWVEDWLFWGCAAVVVFRTVFSLNRGAVRGFFIVSFVLALIGYRYVLGDRVPEGIVKIFSWIFRPYVWIRRKIAKKRKNNLK